MMPSFNVLSDDRSDVSKTDRLKPGTCKRDILLKCEPYKMAYSECL